MNKKIKNILLISFVFLGCSSVATVPKLELRTLRISKKVIGFEYRYCVKHKFLSSKCKRYNTEYYDISKKEVRDKLLNMGFVLKIRIKP